jgi:hypothetical protein
MHSQELEFQSDAAAAVDQAAGPHPGAKILAAAVIVCAAVAVLLASGLAVVMSLS